MKLVQRIRIFEVCSQKTNLATRGSSVMTHHKLRHDAPACVTLYTVEVYNPS